MDLYAAEIDGIALEIETIEDVFEKSIVRHEIPNQDGAILEDMGQKARPVNMRAYFWDEGAHLTYDDHIKLVNHLASQSLSELVHPKYGRMQGMVERLSVRHDDRLRTAEVDIAFVESLRSTIPDARHEDVTAAVEEAFAVGQEEQQDELAGDLSGEDLDLEQDLDPEQSILSQLATTTRSAREMARELDGYLTLANGIADQVDQGADSLVSVINYGVNLPGRVIGVLARMVERTARTYDAVRTSPARFIKSLRLAFQNLENQFALFSPRSSAAAHRSREVMIKHLQVAAAQRLSVEAAAVYNEDERKRQEVRQAENAQSFDLNGNYIGIETEAVLNVRELEESLADTRELLQSAVDQARAMQSLKTMAVSLLDHVSIVKLERDRIITVAVDGPLPLHLICLQYGLPYRMAERLVAINDIPKPNQVDGEILIYVR